MRMRYFKALAVASPLQAACCIQYQAVTRKGKQDVIAAMRGTLQQPGIAGGVEAMQFNQVAALLHRLNDGFHVTRLWPCASAGA